MNIIFMKRGRIEPTNKNSELRVLLEKVCDTYPDFVHGVMLVVRDEGESVADKLIKYIKANQKATSSDITVFLDEIIGIPKWNQEKECFE